MKIPLKQYKNEGLTDVGQIRRIHNLIKNFQKLLWSRSRVGWGVPITKVTPGTESWKIQGIY